MDNLTRSPAMAAFYRSITTHREIEVLSRGLVVLFAEPYNTKVAALLRSNGIVLGDGVSRSLTQEDLGEDVLVLTMDREEKKRLYEGFPDAPNVYTVIEFCGGSGDIIDPYGGDNEVYALLFESFKTWVPLIDPSIDSFGKYKDDTSESDNGIPKTGEQL